MYDEIDDLVHGSVATGEAAFRPGRPLTQPEDDSDPSDEGDEQPGQRDNGAQVSDPDSDKSEDDTQDTVHFIALLFVTCNLS